MLNAYWEKQQKDTLALMQPFVEYAIGATSRKGKPINIETVHKKIESEFGYDEIPLPVIQKIMERMSGHLLSKRNGKFYLREEMTAKLEAFKQKQREFKEHKNAVGDSLTGFLAAYGVADISKEEALDALAEFLEKYGVSFIRNNDSLAMVGKSKDSLQYYIARFIINEKDNNTIVFDYIIDMVNGLFLSTAIYLQPTNSALQSKMKDLACYIDTRILLNALGFNTDEEKRAANQLLDMAKEQGASIRCFRITVEEVRRILYAYRKSLQNPSSNPAQQTLDGLDALKYTPLRVDSLLIILDSRIRELGVEISEPVTLSPDSQALSQYEELEEALIDAIQYSTDEAPSHDAHCITSVYNERAGAQSTSIEKCKSVFITTNKRLARYGKIPTDARRTEYVPLVMTDQDFASIVWLKCYGTHRDYPKIKLIEDATLSLLPSKEVLDTFIANVDSYEKEGGITREMAMALRAGYYNKFDLMAHIGGDVNKIGFDTVQKMEEGIRLSIASQEIRKRETAEADLANEKQKALEAANLAYAEIEKAGQAQHAIVAQRLKRAASIILIAVAIISLPCIYFGTLHSAGHLVPGIILLVIGIVGLYDIFKSRQQWIAQRIKKCADNSAEKAREKKRREYAKLLETLEH